MANEAVSTSLRNARTALTRDAIVGAARELFLSRGYVATSIAAIAEEAGVAVQTVYNSVGAKAELLSAVLDAVAAGRDAPTPVVQLMEQRAAATADADELLDLLADWFVDVNERAAAVFAMIRQAAVVDPDAAALERNRAAQRLRNYRLASAALRERGGVSADLDDGRAAATIFALGHPEVYRALVADGGWPVATYRAWIRRGIAALAA
jgi:Bacterial regulatory proteins, tetR family.